MPPAEAGKEIQRHTEPGDRQSRKWKDEQQQPLRQQTRRCVSLIEMTEARVLAQPCAKRYLWSVVGCLPEMRSQNFALLADETCKIGKNRFCSPLGGVTSQVFTTIQALTDFFNDVFSNFRNLVETGQQSINSADIVASDVGSDDKSDGNARWPARPALRPGTGGIFEFPGSILTASSSLNRTNYNPTDLNRLLLLKHAAYLLVRLLWSRSTQMTTAKSLPATETADVSRPAPAQKEIPAVADSTNPAETLPAVPAPKKISCSRSH